MPEGKRLNQSSQIAYSKLSNRQLNRVSADRPSLQPRRVANHRPPPPTLHPHRAADLGPIRVSGHPIRQPPTALQRNYLLNNKSEQFDAVTVGKNSGATPRSAEPMRDGAA